MARIQSTHRYWLLLVFIMGLVVSSFGQNNIVYVNALANGANDGSSWTDAYTNLHSALLNPNAEIWVAAGTYLPHPSDPDISFILQGKQSLYGGFAGGEIMRSEREPDTNPTILSGDLGQDDLSVPTAVATDIVGVNSDHVLTYWAEQNDTITIDGFMIVGGDAAPVSTNFGGAVFMRLSINNQLGEIKVSFSNCTFQGNRARSGGAIGAATLAGGAQDIRINNCLFRGNEALVSAQASGGAILFQGTAGTIMKNRIEHSRFIRNTCGAGGGAVLIDLTYSVNNTLIADCVFENNQAIGVWGSGGGALAIRNSRGEIDAQIIRCQFVDNQISTSGIAGSTIERGGAIGVEQNNISDSSWLKITDCHFFNNQVSAKGMGSALAVRTSSTASVILPENTYPIFLVVDSSSFVANGLPTGTAGDGGAIGIITTDSKSDVSIRNSVFEQNRANNGGGIYIEDIDQANTNLLIENCQLIDNLSQNQGGALALNCNAKQTPYLLKADIHNSRFVDNVALAGGALGLNLNGFIQAQADLRFEDNYFGHNRANFIGGAISSTLENPQSVNFHLVRDTFEFNQSFTEGGAIHTDDSGVGNIVWKMEQSLLAANKASFGGGAYFSSNGGTLYQIEMLHSQMSRDSAASGAALYLEGLKGFATLDHLLISENQSNNTAAAFQVNTDQNLALRLFSSSLSRNQALGNADVCQLQTQGVGSITFDVFNSIFWDNGNGTDILSLGNVTSTYAHSLFESLLPGDNNLSEDPRFIDPENGDFQLDWTSAAVDAGNTSFLNPNTDLNNNPRIQGGGLDLGAYESPFTTSVKSPTQAQIAFFPNPSQGQVFISLSQFSIYDEVSVKLYDPLGKLVFEDRFAERLDEELALDFGQLNAGLFLLTVQIGEQSYSQNLIIH
ncbi:MAG: T9SS type A sorting domain-containing protein [Bacteroidota bacterium]